MSREEEVDTGVEAPTVGAVESLIESALDSLESSEEQQQQQDAIDELAWMARESEPEVQAMAFWGLGEVVKDRNDAIGSMALDKLDQISHYSSVKAEQTLARETIRRVLQARKD